MDEHDLFNLNLIAAFLSPSCLWKDLQPLLAAGHVPTVESSFDRKILRAMGYWCDEPLCGSSDRAELVHDLDEKQRLEVELEELTTWQRK